MTKKKERKDVKKYESKAQNPNYKKKTKKDEEFYTDPVDLG
ncbi:hypothetical protein [Oceanirhabdus sp. W0125-5]|nr:hypothetical protein [Oceanirhabdus sp. W0125-5]WBW94850.1 hypothetical protein OW730_14215 [Oceanirhabdus sp. W0125-5]